MCIYFPDETPNLTYSKQEHIFPAGLGGKSKLAKGIVSDQANELFSKLEIALMRHSLLSFERALFGPGKRGSLIVQNASKSPIHFSIEEETQKPILSYISLGKPYTISQFLFQNNRGWSVSAPVEYEYNEDTFLRFLNQLKRFNKVFTYIQGNELNENDIIIGYHDKKFYVSTKNGRPSTQEVKNAIMKFINNFVISPIKIGNNHIQQHFSIIENEEISRAYAKVAINILTHLEGTKLINHHNFHEIKQWILTGESANEYFHLPSLIDQTTNNICKLFQSKEHWCIFSCVDDKLCTLVCFYNRYLRQFVLGKLPENIKLDYPIGYICDWKNEKEYTLLDYVLNMAKANHYQLCNN